MMDKRRVHDRQDTDVQRRVQGSGGAGKDYGAKSQAEIAREHRFKPDILARWERQFLENASSLFEKERSNHEAEARIAELEQALGRKTLELEVAKKP